MNQQKTSWIQVWPFKKIDGKERFLKIQNSQAKVRFSQELKNYCNKLWKPKAEQGWRSSWAAFAEDIRFGERAIQIDCGAMPFKYIFGLDDALIKGNPLAPEQQFINCLSVGFPTITKDGFIIFQRRPLGVNASDTLIHEPCGYMASINFAPFKECDLKKYSNDPRLFDLIFQLDYRKNEIASLFGIHSDLVSYKSTQDFLATDSLGGCELYFSTTGKIDCSKSDLEKSFNQKIIKAKKENDERTARKLETIEFFFVPAEDLEGLILNQGKLAKVKQKGYRPSNPKDIPMIGESTIGLIYGYEELTGQKLNIPETINRLKYDGLEIKVHDTSPGQFYEFPKEFGFSPNPETKKLISGANTQAFQYFTEKDKQEMKSFYSRKWIKNRVEGITPENLIQNIFNNLNNGFNFKEHVHCAIERRRNNPATYNEEKGYFVDAEGNAIIDYDKTRLKVCKGLVNYFCGIENNKTEDKEIKGKNLVKYLR